MKQKISKISILTAIFIILTGIISTPLFCDERTENIDVFLVLDKSLSMVEEIDSVAEYVVQELVEATLIPGDFFLVIQFYGKAETLVTREITDSGSSKAEVESIIRDIEADGHFTDIGNALDSLRTTLSRYEDRNRRRYMLLITDGKQEAPPESKYYSPDGIFNHEFLENSKVIQKQGWKIHILGIGSGTSARELAESLSADYSEVSGSADAQELAESTREFLGTVEASVPASISAFSKKGKGKINLTLSSTGYSETKSIRIKTLFIKWEDKEYIAASDISLDVPAEGSITETIPLELKNYTEASGRVAAGSLELRAEFYPGTVYTPGILTIPVSRVSFLERFWPMLLALLLVLLIIVLIVVLIARGTFSSSSIEVEVDFEDSGEKKFFTLGEKTLLFISEGINGISVAARKTGEILATLHTEGDQLILKQEKDDVLLGGPLKGNIFGRNLKIRNRYGKFTGLLFRRKS